MHYYDAHKTSPFLCFRNFESQFPTICQNSNPSDFLYGCGFVQSTEEGANRGCGGKFKVVAVNMVIWLCGGGSKVEGEVVLDGTGIKWDLGDEVACDMVHLSNMSGHVK